MGKRKATKGEIVNNNSNNNSSNSQLDTILSILDLCGFYDNTTCPRMQLIDVLEALRIRYSRHAWWDEHLQMTEAVSQEILQLEELLVKVRDRCTHYETKLKDDFVEWTELQQHAVPALWKYRKESLCSSYKIQHNNETVALRNLTLAFDRIYARPDPNHKSLDQCLEWTIQCLHRYGLLDRIDFQEVVSICHQSPPDSQLAYVGNEVTATECTIKSEEVSASSQVIQSVTSADNVLDAVRFFIHESRDTSTNSSSFFTTLLVIGPEGSGKTYLCDEVESLANETSCQVIRPRLPIDTLGSAVGEAEDTVVAMFNAARVSATPVILLLDGLDHILVEVSSQPSASTGNTSSVWKRSTSTFLSVVDAMRAHPEQSTHILVLCTSTRKTDVLYNRYDRVHYLEPPNEIERKRLLISFVPILKNDTSMQEENREQMVNDLVEATLGKSYAELVLCCRQAIEDLSTQGMSKISARLFFHSLKNRLDTFAPLSLQTGVLADSVDMRILAARDLMKPNECFSFSMKGDSAVVAWKVLVESIVIPMCRSKELKNLLVRSGTSASKVLVGGVLLEGESGSGKTRIAMDCGQYAVSLLPSIKVLDVSCTSLIHKEVGGSERAVQRLFDSARKASPCIVILEGIENVAAVRGNDPTTEGTLDRVLATLLTEMDGVNGSSQHEGGIAVIGITHNSSLIDAAIQRPGRLQRTITMEKDW